MGAGRAGHVQAQQPLGIAVHELAQDLVLQVPRLDGAKALADEQGTALGIERAIGAESERSGPRKSSPQRIAGAEPLTDVSAYSMWK